MPKITVQPSGKVYEYEPGGTLLEILLAQKIFVDNPCNGKGVCGKCRIRVLNGDLETPGETEQRILKEEELAAGVRLSCLVKPDCDLEVELMHKESMKFLPAVMFRSLILRWIFRKKLLRSANPPWKTR